MDKLKSAFEAWARLYARHMDSDESEYSWSAWKAATAQCVPDGFVVVPKEPTEVMLVIGQEALKCVPRDSAIEDCKESEAAYRAMLAASPKPGEQA